MKMLSLILPLIFCVQSVFSAPTENLTVRNGEQINIISPDYPKSPPTGTNLKWNIKTEANSNLLLFCSDLRISKSENCAKGYFLVDDGNEKVKLCGSEIGLTIRSLNNVMKLEFDLNWALGMANCTVKSVDEDIARVTDDHNGQEIELIPGKDAFDKIYYTSMSRNTKKRWIFTTKPGAFISVHCSQIAFDKECDKVKLEITDDKEKQTICESSTNFKTMSKSNKITIELTTGQWHKLRLNCLVQAVTGKDEFEYRNIASTEVDSSEYGQKEGARKTDCKCGWSAKSPGRIVNGQKVADGQYPWIVSLKHKGYHMCGGSIITENHILTAAHCFVNRQEPNEWKVFIGTTNNTHTLNGQQIRVKQIINHEYDGGNYHFNDMTILLLENKIEFTNRIGPVCLTPEKIPLDHKFITVMGWGNLGKEGGNINPQQLMRAHMRVVDYNTCSYLWYRKFDTSDRKKVCTWATNRDSCFGDSGGPLVWLDPETNRYTQVALVSFGRGCNTDFPKINTNVAHYYPWIQEVIKSTKPGVKTCKKI